MVAGRNPHSRVQIWRKNSSQSFGNYYQVGDVSVHDGICVAEQTIADDTYLCILHDNLRVPVQPGDILGLELPATDSDEIYFTSGGPTNYIFKHPDPLDSNVNLSLNLSSTAKQLPQIMFNITSGKSRVRIIHSSHTHTILCNLV